MSLSIINVEINRLKTNDEMEREEKEQQKKEKIIASRDFPLKQSYVYNNNNNNKYTINCKPFVKKYKILYIKDHGSNSSK